MSNLSESFGYMDTIQNIVAKHKHVRRSDYTPEEFLEASIYVNVEDVVQTLKEIKLNPVGGDEHFTNGWNQAIARIRGMMVAQMKDVVKKNLK